MFCITQIIGPQGKEKRKCMGSHVSMAGYSLGVYVELLTLKTGKHVMHFETQGLDKIPMIKAPGCCWEKVKLKKNKKNSPIKFGKKFLSRCFPIIHTYIEDFDAEIKNGEMKVRFSGFAPTGFGGRQTVTLQKRKCKFICEDGDDKIEL